MSINFSEEGSPPVYQKLTTNKRNVADQSFPQMSIRLLDSDALIFVLFKKGKHRFEFDRKTIFGITSDRKLRFDSSHCPECISMHECVKLNHSGIKGVDNINGLLAAAIFLHSCRKTLSEKSNRKLNVFKDLRVQTPNSYTDIEKEVIVKAAYIAGFSNVHVMCNDELNESTSAVRIMDLRGNNIGEGDRFIIIYQSFFNLLHGSIYAVKKTIDQGICYQKYTSNLIT